MIANEASFPHGRPTPEVFDAARGFDGKGGWSGGLAAGSRIVTLPKGCHLVRLHDGSTPFGGWWFTPAEYRRITSAFGVSHARVVEGRDSGESLLHYTLALLSEWYRDRVDQITRFAIIWLEAEFYAFYGEGAPVKTKSGRYRGAANIAGGAPARQIYLPHLPYYRDDYTVLVQSELTDVLLPLRLDALPPTKPYPFEEL